MLLDEVWDGVRYRDPRTVDVHIRWLREKIEENPSRRGAPSPCMASATSSWSNPMRSIRWRLMLTYCAVTLSLYRGTQRRLASCRGAQLCR